MNSSLVNADRIKELLDSGQLNQAIAEANAAIDSEPENSLYRELLGTAERRKRLLEKFSTGASGAREIRCPSCGLAHRVVCGSSMAISCYGCGTLTDIQSLKSLGTVRTIKSNSFLKIGLEGILDQKRLEVIGRASYEASIREWDSEDKKYEQGSWRWVEWSLLTESGEVWYLCVDNEGCSISRPIVPENPQVPRSINDKLSFGGKAGVFGGNRIDEWGVARVVTCEGEFSWVPDPQEKIEYAEYISNRCVEGVEWRSGQEGKEAVEAEFYRAISISYEDLLRVFNQRELLQEVVQERKYCAQRWRWALPFFVVTLVFWLCSMGATQSGKRIFSQSVPSIGNLPDDGTLLGPIPLNRTASVHRLHFSVNIPDNSDMWVGAELLDENQDAINAEQGDFWRESGYDDGEHYSESEVSRDLIFFLRQAGTYYVRVYGEPDPNKPVDGEARVEIFEGATASRLYFMSGLMMLLVGLVVAPLTRIRKRMAL